MRALLAFAAAAAFVTGCNRADNTDATGDLNSNLVSDDLTAEQNAALDAGGMDANVATNAETENMMMNDLTTNDADTNLANGL